MGQNVSDQGSGIRRYFELFEAAFDELHKIVIDYVAQPNSYILSHSDYPIMYDLGSPFPYFGTSGFGSTDTPKDYVGSVRPLGLAAVLLRQRVPDIKLPASEALTEFLLSHSIGSRLNISNGPEGGKRPSGLVDQLVNAAVARYLHVCGVSASIDTTQRFRIILPLIKGTVSDVLNVHLIVPVALTNFEIDRFRLSDNCFIMRMPKKIQLARVRLRNFGSSAVENVVGAATHAFVSKNWQVPGKDVSAVSRSLSEASPSVIEDIDRFFGSIRIVTGVSTGYAQIVWYPKKWAHNYYCDLPPLFGTTIRRYPEQYDRYGWTQASSSITAAQLQEIRRVFIAVTSDGKESVRLAIRRLNSCLTRTDDADAILDATIGLELLLGDDGNEALGYKLRLRAGALARIRGDSSSSAKNIVSRVKRLYEVRSSIVHGRSRKVSKTASGSNSAEHSSGREEAAELLRFVLGVLIANPEYQEPNKIDEFLLRGESGGEA